MKRLRLSRTRHRAPHPSRLVLQLEQFEEHASPTGLAGAAGLFALPLVAFPPAAFDLHGRPIESLFEDSAPRPSHPDAAAPEAIGSPGLRHLGPQLGGPRVKRRKGKSRASMPASSTRSCSRRTT